MLICLDTIVYADMVTFDILRVNCERKKLYKMLKYLKILQGIVNFGATNIKKTKSPLFNNQIKGWKSIKVILK